MNELLEFLQRFLENFEPCSSCDGEGTDQDTGDACDTCGGTGIRIKSRGYLLADLEPEARALLEKYKEITHE